MDLDKNHWASENILPGALSFHGVYDFIDYFVFEPPAEGFVQRSHYQPGTFHIAWKIRIT